MSDDIVLITRRTIRASPTRLFDAWTEPEQLRAWWGPRPVTCTSAQVDLRVGGRYEITNLLPDGATVIISGKFELIDRPRLLVYSWHAGDDQGSRVSVRFDARGEATEVIVIHERIPSTSIRQSHEAGWNGCLDGLEQHFVTG